MLDQWVYKLIRKKYRHRIIYASTRAKFVDVEFMFSKADTI